MVWLFLSDAGEDSVALDLCERRLWTARCTWQKLQTQSLCYILSKTIPVTSFRKILLTTCYSIKKSSDNKMFILALENFNSRKTQT